ncbi:MAG: DUF3783 domain-containing protein [Deltaproteobacteria bacterium]|nr:DUF3783 domain-containing protein [Deltaproteobacteria bacterium]
MNDEYYEKLAASERRYPGPNVFFVSGYTQAEADTLQEFLHLLGYENVPVKACTLDQLDTRLNTVLTEETETAPVGEGKLPHAMIFSGMTANDVQLVMRRFSECSLPRPIFATTTPTNLDFTVKELLKHLLAEARAAGNR